MIVHWASVLYWKSVSRQYMALPESHKMSQGRLRSLSMSGQHTTVLNKQWFTRYSKALELCSGRLLSFWGLSRSPTFKMWWLWMARGNGCVDDPPSVATILIHIQNKYDRLKLITSMLHFTLSRVETSSQIYRAIWMIGKLGSQEPTQSEASKFREHFLSWYD